MLTIPEIIIMLRMIRAIANFISQILLKFLAGYYKEKKTFLLEKTATF
jgi:hypothetical protein